MTYGMSNEPRHEDFCHGWAIGCQRCLRIVLKRWVGTVGWGMVRAALDELKPNGPAWKR